MSAGVTLTPEAMGPRARSLRAATLALAAMAEAAGAEPSGLTPGATVVVVVGLPGDVESERAYARQLERLLEALAHPSARPERVVVLADTPAAVRFPAGLRGEARSNARESLLALAAERAGAEGPLVLIAWGHGGRIGTAPVFHVRGPRIAPADLARLTAGRGQASAILYFRGSGAFARAMDGGGRRVLASEDATEFRSDPIGVELFVEALRATPGADLEPLADRVGRETVRWYEGQRLARQEEPTLFGPRGPRRLADETVAAETAEAAPADSATPPTAAWEGIAAVAAGRFPGADAVVLRHVTRTTIGSSPAVVLEVDSFVQVLTEEGEARGDVDVSYAPPGERLVFLDLEVRHPDGRTTRVDPSTIGEAGVRELAPGYVAPARRVFSLPGVAPGAILRVHYRSEWARFPLPHVFLETPLAHDAPALETVVEVGVGSGTPLHFAARGMEPPPPAVAETAHGRTYTWRLGETAAVVAEALGPHDTVPRLQLSTFPDWASFAAWYGRLIELADDVTPEIEAAAAAIVRGRATPREKVVALYDFVTGLRYVAVPLGVNSHRPHAAANVLRNRYGDCKDKANLFNTLLRTQGITAHLVLVPRFGQVDPRTPGLGFNHAISRVSLEGETIWADTTDEFARFGLLPPGDPGRDVLVVDGGAGLTRLPAPDPAAHRIEMRVDVAAGERSRVEVSAHGFADYALRQAARASAGAGATRPAIAEAFRPTTGSFALRAQAHTPVPDLQRPFEWKGEGRWAGLTTPGANGDLLVAAPFWLPREWEGAVHERKTPLFLNHGYPLVLRQEAHIALPPGFGASHLPPPAAGEAAPLRYRLAWARAESGVRARLDVELTTGELTAGDTVAFQAQLAELTRALSTPAVAGAARTGERQGR